MHYAILCYHDEDEANAWTKAEAEAVLAKRAVVTDRLALEGKLGPSASLMATSTAVTVRWGKQAVVIDGPFAETKEQLLGFYIVECETLDEAVAIAQEIVRDESGAIEVRPLRLFHRGDVDT